MSDFDPGRDIEVKFTPSGDGHEARSSGLDAFGRKELLVDGVPESQVQNAGILINRVAVYVVETPVNSGERVGIELGTHMLIVTLYDLDDQTQVIVDGHVESKKVDVPRVGLTTVALARARQALHQDMRHDALVILEDSIDFYPGDTVADKEPYFGVPYNWQNYLTYEELSKQYAGQTGIDHLRDACERSVILQGRILGAPLELFESIEADSVSNRAAFIHRTNVQSFQADQGPNESLMIVVSPLWSLGEDDAVHRSLAMVPRNLVELYWNQDVIEAVDSQPVYDLIGEAVETFARDPVTLAARVSRARRLWTDPSAPARKFDLEYVNGDVLFSSLVAHVARLMFGGADLPVLRASLGLSDHAADEDALEEIEDELERIEARAYSAAMSEK